MEELHDLAPHLACDQQRWCLQAIELPGGTHLAVRLQARRELLPAGSGAVCFIALGELDWDPAALQTDFFGHDAETITALAVLVDSRTLTLVANMYFSLFPARFPTKVFNTDAEARQWLAAKAQ